MAGLSVAGGVLQYKKTSYQISQITSVMPLTLKRERKIDYVSLKPILPLILFAVLLGLTGASLLKNGEGLTALFFFGAAVSMVFFCYRRISVRLSQNKEDTHVLMYGISLYISNGDKELFVSSNEDTIQKVCDAVTEAMKGNSGTLVNIPNAKIEISNSKDFTVVGTQT